MGHGFSLRDGERMSHEWREVFRILLLVVCMITYIAILGSLAHCSVWVLAYLFKSKVCIVFLGEWGSSEKAGMQWDQYPIYSLKLEKLERVLDIRIQTGDHHLRICFSGHLVNVGFRIFRLSRFRGTRRSAKEQRTHTHLMLSCLHIPW